MELQFEIEEIIDRIENLNKKRNNLLDELTIMDDEKSASYLTDKVEEIEFEIECLEDELQALEDEEMARWEAERAYAIREYERGLL